MAHRCAILPSWHYRGCFMCATLNGSPSLGQVLIKFPVLMSLCILLSGGGTQSWRSPQAGKGSFVHWCWGCMEAGRLARMGLCACPCPYLHPGLHQVQPQRQGLPHEHVRVVALVESLLQLLQLPAGEIGARPSSLTTGAFLIRVHRVWERGRKTVILTSDLRLGS